MQATGVKLVKEGSSKRSFINVSLVALSDENIGVSLQVWCANYSSFRTGNSTWQIKDDESDVHLTLPGLKRYNSPSA